MGRFQVNLHPLRLSTQIHLCPSNGFFVSIHHLRQGSLERRICRCRDWLIQGHICDIPRHQEFKAGFLSTGCHISNACYTTGSSACQCLLGQRNGQWHQNDAIECLLDYRSQLVFTQTLSQYFAIRTYQNDPGQALRCVVPGNGRVNLVTLVYLTHKHLRPGNVRFLDVFLDLFKCVVGAKSQDGEFRMLGIGIVEFFEHVKLRVERRGPETEQHIFAPIL